MFENLLLGDDLCEVFEGGTARYNQTVKSNYCLRDHANCYSKFCFYINWTNVSTLNILICLVPQIALTRKFYEGLVSIYNMNCLLHGNAFA